MARIERRRGPSRLVARPATCLAGLTGVLILLSVAAGVLFAVRADRVGRAAFDFLGWNLFLAWVPYLFAVGMAVVQRSRGPRALCWLLGCGWLLFLPNAPYLLTDFVHLGRAGAAPLWFDAALIGAFAVSGLSLGLASLLVVHQLVEAAAGPRTGWAVVTGSVLLTALGVYLGRFGRFNSWDLVTDPAGLATVVVHRLANPLGNPFLLQFAAAGSVLLLLSYLSVWAIARGLLGRVRTR